MESKKTRNTLMDVDPGTFMRPPKGYALLGSVLCDALDQAAFGKGKERHVTDGAPFEDQPMMRIARSVGVGAPIRQVLKKAEEAMGMVDRGEVAAARHELLGAIIYAAGAILALPGGAGASVIGGTEESPAPKSGPITWPDHLPRTGLEWETPYAAPKSKNSSPATPGRTPEPSKSMFARARAWLGRFLERDLFRG